MTQTQYFVAQSLDGFIADRDHGIDWLTAFDGTPGISEHYEAFIADVGALAMGARTYEFLLRHGGPWPYGERPSWVFTHRTLPGIEGADIRFCAEDAAREHPHMLAAAGGKNLWLVGGGALAAQLLRRALVDELWLTVIPVVLGGGVPSFGEATLPEMTLTHVTRFERGLVELRYQLPRASR
jgi:dihydrofolate reductase